MGGLNTDFSINVNASVDTSLIQKTLSQNKFVIKADVDTKNLVTDIEKKINNLFQSSNLGERINRTMQQGVVGIDKYGKSIDNCVKYVETFKTSLGDVNERITLLKKNDMTGKLKVVDQSMNQLKKGIESINTEITKSKSSMNGFPSEITTIKKTVQDTSGAIKTVVESTEQWVDSNNKLHTQIRTEDELGNQLSATINKISDNTTKLATVQNNTSNTSQKLGQSFSAIVEKVSKFYLATLPMQAFTRTVTEAKEIVVEFDKAITEMGKVSSYSGDQLQQFTRDLADMGTSVGRTMTEMTEATTGWIKAGYNEEDASKLAQYSALLQNTADEQLSSSEATSILVSQLKAYNLTVDETIKVTDILNNVSANEAVSSGDLAKGLTQASASMATYGNSIEETTALLTAGTTVFQNKSQQVARGLNAISTRIVKYREDVEKAISTYTGDAYSIEKSNGELKSTYQILTDLKGAWDAMGDAERATFQTTVAGVNQGKIFAAVMSQMDVATKSYSQALMSYGSTMKQNEVYMNSLEAKVKALKAEFEKLVLGNGGTQSVAKSFVAIGTNVLKFINYLGGLRTVLIALTGTLITLNVEGMIAFATNCGKTVVSLGEMIAKFISARLAGTSFSGSLLVAGASASALQVALMGATAVITGFVVAISAMKHAQEEATLKAKEAVEEYKNYETSITDVISKITDEGVSKESLIELNKNLYKTYDEEKEQLKDINDLRQEAISKIYEEARAKAQETVRNTGSQYAKSKDFLESEYSVKIGSNYQKTFENPSEAVEEFGEKIDELNAKMAENGELTNSEKTALKGYEDQYEKAKQKVDDAKEVVEGYESSIKVLNSTQDEWVNSQNESSKANQEQISSLDDLDDSLEQISTEVIALADAYGVNAEDLQNWAKELSLTEEALVAYADSIGMSVEGAYNTLSAFQSVNNTIDSLQSSYTTLASAVDEYNSTGSFSIDTMQSLLSISPEYLTLLSEENGQLVLNEQAIQNKVLAQAEEAKQTIYNTAIDRLNELQAKATGDASEEAGNKHSGAVGGIDAETEALARNNVEQAKNNALKAGAESGDVNKIISEMEAQINAVDKAVAGMGSNFANSMGRATSATNKNTKATGGNSSARKSNTEATKEQTEATKAQKEALEAEKKALEEVKDEYESAINYLASRLKEEIEKLKDKQEKATDKIAQKASGIASTIVEVYEKEQNEIDKILDKVKKAFESNLKNINSLLKEAESNYRKDMDNIVSDFDDFMKKLSDFDEYSKKGITAFQDTEYESLSKELTSVQTRIDRLTDERDEALEQSNYTAVQDYEEQIEQNQKIEQELYKQMTLLKEKEELEKIVADTEDKIKKLTIKKLEEEKDKLEETYDKQNEALEKTNGKLEEQLKLQEALEKLAKAKASRVMVYKNGEWTYQENENEVSTAQDNYAEVKREQEKTAITNQLKEEQEKQIETITNKIKELEKETEKSYDQQIKDAQQYLIDIKAEYAKQETAYKDKIEKRNETFQIEVTNLSNKATREIQQYKKVEASLKELSTQYDLVSKTYDNQIAKLQQLLDKVNEIKTAMKDDGKNAFEKIFEVDGEKIKSNLDVILGKLGDFKTSYATVVGQIKDLSSQITNLPTGTTSTPTTSTDSNSDNSKAKDTATDTDPKINIRKKAMDVSKKDSKDQVYEKQKLEKSNPNNKYTLVNGIIYQVKTVKTSEFTKGKDTTYKGWAKYASGVASVSGNQIAITGENPYKEIVLGSKANGVLTSIDKGGGVVNAQSTKTLAGLLNALGRYSSSNFGGANGVLNNNNSSNSTKIEIGNISLPSVSNGKEFVDYLQNFSLDMMQASY